MTPLNCIYCKKQMDFASTSKSDIIPDFFGNGLILENAVCKICNNDFNTQVEQKLRNYFQYLRSGLDLRGRRKKPVKLLAEIEVDSLGKKMKVDLDHINTKGIPPFKFKGENGKEYYAVIGKKEYIKDKKREISDKKPKIKWQESNSKGEVTLTIGTLPIEVMYGELGKRLAAKIAFERLCQKKSSLVVNDRVYDNIRNYVRYGKCKREVSTLIYNEQIMTVNMNFPFPYHCIVLTNDLKRNRLVGVVSIFGLYYYLVLISDYLSIRAPWDNCVTVDPQESNEYESSIRCTGTINIPDEAWVMTESKLPFVGKFAHKKLKSTLESRAFIIGSEEN